MSYQKHNFEAGAVLFASQLNDMDNQIEFLSNQGSSFSDDFKEALLNCFENVAWINENGQAYYDALYDSLYPDNMWFITNILTGCTTSNNATSILKNNSYVATITANQGYTLNGATVNILMGGNDVTNLYYSSGSINIPNVTGDLVITVTASSSVVSIDAVFTQGSAKIYDTDTLDTLRQYLVVTATYSDSTTAVVTDYTLSGTLTAGTSTITVSYSGETDTFSVTVTAWTLQWSVLDGGLPTAVAPNDWQASRIGTTGNSVTFDQTNGIKWVGNAGSYDIWPTNYTTASNSVLEIIVNFKTISAITDIMLYLARTNDSLIAMLYSDGIHVNYAANPAIGGTAFATNMDYVLRLERTSTNGKITLNNTLIYNGEIRTGRSDTNKITLTTTGSGSAWEGYIKAIRYWEG